MNDARIYVCDDELLIRMWLVEHLEEQGYEARGFENGQDLITACKGDPPDLVLLDLRLPDGSGLDFLTEVKEMDSSIPVIMISAYGEVETAVAAVRAGAHHFLEKPVDLPELFLLVEQALETRGLIGELRRHREGHRWHFSGVTLVGRSPAIQGIAEIITRLAARGAPATVLIKGDSGTGKDVVARAIHALGPRQDRPFITVNCTVLPDHLVESELFGHEAGAFTDAKRAKIGLFELADGGTIFLDEIGDMAKAAQAKVLEVLETGRFRRVGGIRDIKVDVHVISATNRDVEKAVEVGDFREDLFYRLNVIPITIPPLRDRPEDIGPLADHLLGLLCNDMSIPVRGFDAGAMTAMDSYGWPGNVRELRNVLERILLLQDEPIISLDQLPPEIRGAPPRPEEDLHFPTEGLLLDDVEKRMIFQAMSQSGGNKSKAARLLGISRDTLRYRLAKYQALGSDGKNRTVDPGGR